MIFNHQMHKSEKFGDFSDIVLTHHTFYTPEGAFPV